jgi:hypothetical protein
MEAIMLGEYNFLRKVTIRFLYLALFSFIGIFLFAIVQKVFVNLASRVVEGTGLSHFYGETGVYLYIVVAWVCPAFIGIGLVGALILYIYQLLHKQHTSIIH